MLAAILGVVTVPLHALVLRAAPSGAVPGRRAAVGPAGEALRTAPFWMLTSAFFVAMAAAVALAVQGIRSCASAATAPASPPSRSASSGSRIPAGCCSRRSPRG